MGNLVSGEDFSEGSMPVGAKAIPPEPDWSAVAAHLRAAVRANAKRGRGRLLRRDGGLAVAAAMLVLNALANAIDRSLDKGTADRWLEPDDEQAAGSRARRDASDAAAVTADLDAADAPPSAAKYPHAISVRRAAHRCADPRQARAQSS